MLLEDFFMSTDDAAIRMTGAQTKARHSAIPCAPLSIRFFVVIPQPVSVPDTSRMKIGLLKRID